MSSRSPAHTFLQNRMRCPSCNKCFSKRYFKIHKDSFLANDVWLCKNVNDSCSSDDLERIGTFEGTNDAGEDITFNEADQIQQLRGNMKRYIRKQLADNDVVEDRSDDEEIWDNVDEEDMDIDIDADRSEHTTQTENMPVTHKFVFYFCIFLCLWQSVNVLSDKCVESILSFFKQYITLFTKDHPFLSTVPVLLPGSIFMLWKTIGLKKDNFIKYVVCRKCYKLYDYDSCITNIEGVRKSKSCTFVQYPNHTQPAKRKACGEQLLREVLLSNGKKKLYPFKTYSYKPIKETLQRFLKRPDFENKCELWRERENRRGRLKDVYDGNIWHEFNSDRHNSFLSNKHSYGIMMNLDWFQPFKHVSYSVGVVYCVILNLPREERFKVNNVILVGVIPDMGKEPKTNTFIRPFVDELEQAWNNGFSMTTFLFPKTEQKIKLALMCVGCDIPATRKLCGFLGHAATLGCSKCLKKFPGDVGNKDYSGFDRNEWLERTISDHKRKLAKIEDSKTQTEQARLESLFGVRSSELNRLSYFDPIRMSIVDPMHNLYQGTSKHMVKLWTTKGYLTSKNLLDIQAKVDAAEVPTNVGRIPRKIASSFGGFTAEQWKLWTNMFSIYALKNILPDNLIHNWRMFVLASCILCSRTITETEVNLADEYLMSFLRDLERKYGRSTVTPNMHLHGHLRQCIFDYGPIHTFWLFSFERYNGHLGSLPNNNRSVEVQFMRRFLRDSNVKNIIIPNEMKTLFGSFDELVVESNTEEIMVDISSEFHALSDPDQAISGRNWAFNIKCELKRLSIHKLNDFEHNCLKKSYKRLYPTLDENTYTVPISCRKCSAIQVGNELVGSFESRYKRSSTVMANWNGFAGSIVDDDETDLRPGVVEKIIVHNLLLDNESKRHVFVIMSWYLPLLDIRKYCGKPVDIWSRKVDVFGEASFMPIQRIRCKCIQVPGKVRNKSVLYICPISRILNV